MSLIIIFLSRPWRLNIAGSFLLLLLFSLQQCRQGTWLGVISGGDDNDYISLTDIAKYKSEDPNDVIKNWLRSKDTIEFLGLWEQLNNPNFKPVEFDGFKKTDVFSTANDQAGLTHEFAQILAEKYPAYDIGALRRTAIYEILEIGLDNCLKRHNIWLPGQEYAKLAKRRLLLVIDDDEGLKKNFRKLKIDVNTALVEMGIRKAVVRDWFTVTDQRIR